MLQLRVRLVKDDGTINASSRVLETLDISYTKTVLTFKVSRKTFTPTVYPFVVRVEYSIDGGRFHRLPRHELFIVEDDSDDSKDDAEIVTYSAVAFVPWLLAGAYVGTGTWQKDNERTINGDGAYNANAGQIMSYFIDESKGRGWLSPLQRSFNSTVDSAGAPWRPADQAKIGWRLETFYNKVLDQLESQGLCEWSTSATSLHLYRPGTLGVDRTDEIVFGGPEFARVPVKTDVTGWYTHVVALSDAGRVHVQNAAAESRFGRRSVAMTQTGVKDAATSTKLANELLAEGLKIKREEAYEWTPDRGGLHPFRDFDEGDMVTARSRGGKLPRRVLGLVIRQQTGPATVQVRVGEKITTLAAKRNKLLSSVAVGGVVGGSGGAFPTSPGLPSAQPDRPDGLRVVANVGSWAADGFTALTEVTLEWAAVTMATDGAEIDIDRYELWSRTPDGHLTFDTEVHGTTAVVPTWLADAQRLVVVYAISTKGVRSEASLELSVTPAAPLSIVPKAPGQVTVASNAGGWTAAGPVAAVTLTIPAVTKSTDDEAIEVAEYELWNADGPLMRLPASPAKVTIPSGGTAVYRARACSTLGVWGDLSAPSVTVTGASPAVQAGRNPTGVTGRTGFGVVVCDWAGTYVAAPAAHTLLNVQVQARVGTTGAWVLQGSMDRAGSVTLQLGEAGQTVQMQAVAYDRLGRVIGTSATVSVVVQGVELGDLDADFQAELDALDTKATNAQTAAGAAQTTADTARAEATSKAAAAETAAKAHADAKAEAARLAAIATASGDATAKADAAKAQAKADAAADATAKADAARAAAEAKAATAQARADAAFTNATNAATAAGQAQTSADGRSRVWYLATAPAGVGHKKDDVWFDTSQGMRMSYWNVTTTSWVLVQFGTQAIANLAITNALIANAAIDNAKIANVDAGKVTTGFLAAARIAAMSITVAKLAIGSFNEIWPDPEWREPGYGGWTATAAVGIQKAGTGTQNGTYVTWADMPVSEGERYLFSIKRTNVAGSGGEANVYVQALDANKALLNTVKTVTTLTPGTFTGERLVPAGAAYLRVGFYTEPNMGAGVTVRFSDLHIRQLQTGALFVDGAVKARHVEMETGFFDKLFGNSASIGRVNVDHLAPNVGENLNISANGTIQMIAGRQNSQDEATAAAQAAADSAGEAAQAGIDLAGSAGARADAAAGAALVAQTLADQVNDALRSHQTVFIVDEYGAIIAAVDRSNELRMRSTYIAMAQNGVEVTRWEGNRMIVNEGVFNRVKIANWSIEAYGTGTVIRQS